MASSEVDLMEAKVNHVKTISHERCKFRGGVFLPDGELLVADQDKSRLLLFAHDFFYLQEFQLPGEPADLTIGSNHKIYVTTYKGKILKCEIDGDDLNVLETYDGPSRTYTIDSYNDELVVCCKSEFKVLDLDCKEIRSISKSGGSDSPIAVSTKLKRVYYREEKAVIGRKMSDGNEVFNFKASDMVTSVALDHQDNVYAALSSKKLVQISKNRRKHRVLVDKFDKVGDPFRLLYHPTKEMFIVFDRSSEFEVYEF